MSYLLFTIGFIIRAISVIQMRGNDVWRVSVPKRFICTGIYKYIRHPMYLGGVFMGAGLTQIALHSWLFTFVFSALVFSWAVDRADREETLMIKTFGKDYVEYISTTKMLIPFIM